ncbi:MAG: phytoene/squalene synthase family protein [Actinomycetia bacterium]|nr:phytoene/squalene synthase family protein [Actinomycetes bacterium]
MVANPARSPQLNASYRKCRQLNAQHGRTYYLATLLLPPTKRPFVHALYGFARSVDDVVDTIPETDIDLRAQKLDQIQAIFEREFAQGQSDHIVLAAVIDTARRWQIDRVEFDAFFDSMRSDLSISSYQTYADLQGYMYGSASVIGRQLVPILEPSSPDAREYAEILGEAFQLANFIRDVGEDLDRGRIYLPLSELAQFGVTEQTLAKRVVTDDVRAALAFQIDRVNRLSDEAALGTALLHPSVRDCIETARILYCQIANAVADIDYQVFTQRATVPMSQRLSVAIPAWRHALAARKQYGSGRIPPLPA